MSGPQLIRDLFVENDTRLRQAWDGDRFGRARAEPPRVPFVFSNVERAALLELARLPGGMVSAAWSDFSELEVQQLLVGALRAIELGKKLAISE